MGGHIPELALRTLGCLIFLLLGFITGVQYADYYPLNAAALGGHMSNHPWLAPAAGLTGGALGYKLIKGRTRPHP